ncbi:MAG: hypothetical protein IIY75_06025, partial [Erysipelotrichales bacterium]|nr:hypothetical protein [Erysipelotrichales bacterium]
MMVIQMIPAKQVKAYEGFPHEPEEITETAKEIYDLRDIDTKHFCNTDGSYTAVKYSAAVHYRESEEEEWKDIDNRLTSSNGMYKPTSSPVDVFFCGETGKEILTSYTDEGHTLSWNYEVYENGKEVPLDSVDGKELTFSDKGELPEYLK